MGSAVGGGDQALCAVPSLGMLALPGYLGSSVGPHRSGDAPSTPARAGVRSSASQVDVHGSVFFHFQWVCTPFKQFARNSQLAELLCDPVDGARPSGGGRSSERDGGDAGG